MLDVSSRFILAWNLAPTMSATDVQETLNAALTATGPDRVRGRHRPRLHLDNGPCPLPKEPHQFLEDQGIDHTRGAQFHPMTQGRIERYHRSLKNLVELVRLLWPLEARAGGGALRRFL